MSHMSFWPRSAALDLFHGAVVDVLYVVHKFRFVAFERKIGVGPI